MFNFEKLEAWHKAIALADVIYSHTRSFPADDLAQQIRCDDQLFRSLPTLRKGRVEVQKRISDGLLRLGLVPCSPIQ